MIETKKQTMRPRTRIPGPTTAFHMRRLQVGTHQKLRMLALAMGRSQEDIANTAMKIGIRAMQKRFADEERNE
jgi:plasmid stability protein